jgi:hypothetical protein
MLRHSITAGILLVAAAAGQGAAQSPRPPEEADLREWWAWLGSNAPAEVTRATLAFAGQPKQTVAFLHQHLRPVQRDEKLVAQWLAELDSEKFPVRQRATRELEYLGKTVKDDLEKALAARPSPEAAGRLKQLLARLKPPAPTKPPPPLPGPGQPVRVSSINGRVILNGVPLERYLQATTPAGPVGPPASWLRAARAVVLLEHIGTPDALRLLERLAEGDAEALPTLEARAALSRRKKAAP